MDENFIEKSDGQTHEVLRDETINISDVIEVIETTDPDFKQSTMYNGGREVPGPSSSRRPQAYVKIVEQPAPKALRFRYECEGRSAGSIPGARSTPDNKTYPTIKIMGYVGKAIVVVSCVTKDEPYKPHPHNLVGREGCRKGVCTLAIGEETMTATFQNLGIQCVKKKDIEAALKVREEIRVDPFRTGFGHRNQPAAIDLNAVRLCFQVFLEDSHGKFTIPLTPVVSDVIYDKKAMSDLIIVKLSQCVCCVDGGTNDIIILCEKVAKEDIEVRFFEKQDSQIVWEARGDFQPSQVHKQTAIWFRPPRYRTLEITEPVKVFIQLRRPSDGATSEALPFQYLPLDSGYDCQRKRKKFEIDPTQIQRLFSERERNISQAQYNVLNIPVDPIKAEPRDSTPSPMYASPYVEPISYLPPVDVTYQPVNTAATWTNMPSTSTVPEQNNLSSLLNLDNQELVQGLDLNTQELEKYNPNNLSENFSSFSLTDVNIQSEPNATDSLTGLVNSTLDMHMQQ